MPLPQHLKRMREIAEKATPGPWELVPDADGKPHHILGMFNGNLKDPVVDCKWASATRRGQDDYRFISTFHPQVALAMLDVVEAAADVRGISEPIGRLHRALTTLEAALSTTPSP